MEEVGNQEQPTRLVEDGVAVGGERCELEDRVDGQELNACATVELARLRSSVPSR